MPAIRPGAVWSATTIPLQVITARTISVHDRGCSAALNASRTSRGSPCRPNQSQPLRLGFFGRIGSGSATGHMMRIAAPRCVRSARSWSSAASRAMVSPAGSARFLAMPGRTRLVPDMLVLLPDSAGGTTGRSIYLSDMRIGELARHRWRAGTNRPSGVWLPDQGVCGGGRGRGLRRAHRFLAKRILADGRDLALEPSATRRAWRPMSWSTPRPSESRPGPHAVLRSAIAALVTWRPAIRHGQLHDVPDQGVAAYRGR